MIAIGRRPSFLIAFFAASASGAAIIVYALGWVTLTYSLTVLAPLTLLLFVSLLVRARGGHEDVLLNRVLGGIVAGVVGLIAYDVIRLLILITGLAPFNPFRPIEVYGLLILDRFEDTTLTKSVGWAFHIWNGISFAIMYTVAFGRGRLLYALGWAMLLEVAMISTYPTIFHLALAWPFLFVSFVGHVAYGLAMGESAKRVVK